ncbi:MAG TPA: RagB/SusD family nutrient uptake outer membrane protein [Phnomibacter sp.]|nr:RagB/SusD family nutrient uptake outer membrane protein [Phnomibacter sp.]
MKKISIVFGLLVLITIGGCDKESLLIPDPNLPTPQGSLTTEVGITSFALGIIDRQFGVVTNAGTVNLFVIAMNNHSIMGDELFSPYGNWGMRWTNQVYSTTLPGNAPIINPIGVTQYGSLIGFNSRQAGDRNSFLYEWYWAYNYISQANALLTALEDPALAFSGDAATKRGLLKAWALWWKGYAYSRLGSMYIAGTIVNKAGTTNGDFVNSTGLLAEANRLLTECETTLNALNPNDTYMAMFRSITPSYNLQNNIIAPDEWKRVINTLKARNLMANKKVTVMSSADWQQVITLSNNGIRATDDVFRQGYTADGNNDVSGGFYHPYWLIFYEFTFVSERLIQEYKTGDGRLTRDWVQLDPTVGYAPNILSRGLQFGTRFAPVDIENGGSFATSSGAAATLPIAGSWEENELNKAEALIYTGQIEQGLQIIDAIRTSQGAGLQGIAGTGLNQAQAIEELRRERRVALFMRGTAFYDARRWGRTAPLSQGGGRTNAVIYLPASLNGGVDGPGLGTLDYRYIDLFDVPQNELDFNQPSSISAPVKN